jgi:GNAT superfamily N-acetyltransferase
MEVTDLRFAEIAPGWEDQLRGFFAVVFGDSPKLEPGIIEWQYWTNPFGEVRPLVALDGDRIVAFSFAWPLPISLGNRPARAGLFIDTSTHPDYQRRGIYFEMKRRVAATVRELGWEFLFSNPRHIRAEARRPGPHWTPLPGPRLFVRPIHRSWTELGNRLPAAARTLSMVWRHRPHPGGKRVSTVPDDVDGLAARLWTESDNGICPSRQWWEWRFVRHPAAPYRFFEHRRNGRLEGAAVVRLTGHEHPTLHILDLLATSPDAARAVVAAAVADAPNAGGVAVRASAGGLQGRAARAAGLIRVPDRIRGLSSHIGISEVFDDRVLQRTRMPWSFTVGGLDYS